MRVFYDTEFIEGNQSLKLISIGAVREDGKTYYAISSEFDPKQANKWVQDNVLAKLGADKQPKNVKTEKQILQDLAEFVGPSPEFWAYYADYDHVVLCQLANRHMVDLPKGWPMYTKDLQQEIDRMGIKPPKQDKTEEHNALNDALWVKKAYEYVIEKSKDK